MNKGLVSFPIREYLAELDSLLPVIRKLVRGEEEDEPALIGECANCQWRQPCREWLEANEDITLVPGISRSHKEKLVALGIRRISDPLSWDRRGERSDSGPRIPLWSRSCGERPGVPVHPGLGG